MKGLYCELCEEYVKGPVLQHCKRAHKPIYQWVKWLNRKARAIKRMAARYV